MPPYVTWTGKPLECYGERWMRCVGLLGLCCVVLAHFACDVATLRSSVISSSSFNSISMVISIFIFFQRTKHLLLARSDQNNPIHY